MAGDGSQSLDEAKENVRREFLGRDGVHGVGVRRIRPAVVVYVADEAACGAAVRDRLHAAAAPYQVILVVQPAASLA